ncbi:MAG: hypothetical protein ABIJ92_01430 [Candidatus Aenigmatarchaeota archaeon]
MDYFMQLGIELIVTGIAVLLMLNFLGRFKIQKSLIYTLVFPFLLFTVGFSLRLSGSQSMIDMGYFFTDFSFLFTYLLFGSSFVLGQLRYWKKN